MTRPTGQPVGVGNPELVAEKERALLVVIAERPGLRACEICAAIEEQAGATMSRLNRLMDRGALERVDHRWYAAGAVPDAAATELSEFEIAERARPPFDPSRWVQHVDFYVRYATSMFACARFG